MRRSSRPRDDTDPPTFTSITELLLLLPNTYIPNIAALIAPPINLIFFPGPSDRPTPFAITGIFASASADSRFTLLRSTMVGLLV